MNNASIASEMTIGPAAKDSLDKKEEMICVLQPRKSQEHLIESGYIKFGRNQDRLDDLISHIQKCTIEGLFFENYANKA